MKKVLLVTDVTFWLKSSGHRVRISTLITYLAKHVELTVVNTGPAPAGIENHLHQQYCAEFYVLENNKYLNSAGYGRRLKAFLKNRHFDAIIIEYLHSSYFLSFLLEDTKVILDAHDIISERANEFKKHSYGGQFYEVDSETEVEILKVYDRVMVLCEADRIKIDTMAGAGKALLCPHPVTLQQHAFRAEVKNIVFVASAYIPNTDGIQFFLDTCWPAIAARYDVTLTVYGTVCENIKPDAYTRVICRGFVYDINQIYEEADIVINPVRFGAGIKIKNIEALAHGRPLVTTSHGTRGIETGRETAYLVADTPEGFIAAVSGLIENTCSRQRMGENALKYIENEFSAEQCFAPLLSEISMSLQEA